MEQEGTAVLNGNYMSKAVFSFPYFKVKLKNGTAGIQYLFDKNFPVVDIWASFPQEIKDFFDNHNYLPKESGFIKFCSFHRYMSYNNTFLKLKNEGKITPLQYDTLTTIPR